MDNFVIGALYAETCERWKKPQQQSELDQWRSNLKDVTEDEAREAIENHAKSRWGSRMPYSGTIYKEAKRLRASTVHPGSLPSEVLFPEKENDNRRFLEYMARQEGRTPEEMEKHIERSVAEWQSKARP